MQSISDAILLHYQNGKSKEELVQAIYDSWTKYRKLKLLDGSYMTKCPTYHPWIHFIQENTKIVMDALKPDCWNTPEEENDLPDWMRIERFGMYGEEQFREVEKRFSLRVKLA